MIPSLLGQRRNPRGPLKRGIHDESPCFTRLFQPLPDRRRRDKSRHSAPQTRRCTKPPPASLPSLQDASPGAFVPLSPIALPCQLPWQLRPGLLPGGDTSCQAYMTMKASEGLLLPPNEEMPSVCFLANLCVRCSEDHASGGTLLSLSWGSARGPFLALGLVDSWAKAAPHPTSAPPAPACLPPWVSVATHPAACHAAAAAGCAPGQFASRTIATLTKGPSLRPHPGCAPEPAVLYSAPRQLLQSLALGPSPGTKHC